jgi:hypothetical protein
MTVARTQFVHARTLILCAVFLYLRNPAYLSSRLRSWLSSSKCQVRSACSGNWARTVTALTFRLSA